MSWLNLKRLLPKKVWKVFTNKLHKLNRSKPIQKPKIRYHKTSKKLAWPSLSRKPTKFKIQTPRRPPPVYVDHLFKEPVYVLKEQLQIQETASSSSKKNLLKTKKEEKQVVNTDAADDMWESLVLGSPQQMRRIDQRADEFIARIRAQMHHQGIQSRRL